MMKKQKKYEDILKDFDPESSIEGTENHYSDEKFWGKVMKYRETSGEDDSLL